MDCPGRDSEAFGQSCDHLPDLSGAVLGQCSAACLANGLIILSHSLVSSLHLLCILTMNSSSFSSYSQADYIPASIAQLSYDFDRQTSLSSEPSPPSKPVVEHRGHHAPRSIAELADLAKASLGEATRPFKTWLRVAESARRSGRQYQDQGDLENSFVEYAKAATVVLEKLPSHKDYRTVLNSAQRHNMGLVSRRTYIPSFDFVRQRDAVRRRDVPGRLLASASCQQDTKSARSILDHQRARRCFADLCRSINVAPFF